MKDATKCEMQRKRLISKDRAAFESMLDSYLRNNFPNRKINSPIAKRVAEEICKEYPEFQSCQKSLTFKKKYFIDFFKRYGWKWDKNKYIPKDPIEEEMIIRSWFCSKNKTNFYRIGRLKYRKTGKCTLR